MTVFKSFATPIIDKFVGSGEHRTSEECGRTGDQCGSFSGGLGECRRGSPQALEVQLFFPACQVAHSDGLADDHWQFQLV